MNEIKFRGYSKQLNRFIYGYINKLINGSFVIDGETSAVVEEESIGQYTGEKDKNGKETFTGDVIRCNHMGFYHFNAQVKLGEYTQDGSGGEYQGTQCIGFYAEAIDKDQVDENGIEIVSDYLETTSLLEFDDFEIIGNAFDNPELLEGAK